MLCMRKEKHTKMSFSGRMPCLKTSLEDTSEPIPHRGSEVHNLKTKMCGIVSVVSFGSVGLPTFEVQVVERGEMSSGLC